jgi:esterase/lipase superfamily enzyme
MDAGSMIHKLPVEPIVPGLATLPVNVLLALGEDATPRDPQSIFNLPARAAALLGDWSSVRTVLNLRIWAPKWDADHFRSYLGEAAKASPGDLPDDTWRASSFLGLPDVDTPERDETTHYEIVHCISDIGKNFDGDSLFSPGAGHRTLAPGALRDVLVRSGTRLLILQSSGRHITGDVTQRLAEFVAGAGGPAVLVVWEGDGRSLDAYLSNLYARILCNQSLEEATAAPESGPSTLLVYGTGGDHLLRFDGLTERLEKQLADYSGLVRRLLRGVRDIEDGRLQVTRGPTAEQLRSLHALDLQIDTELTLLTDAKASVSAHALEGVSLLSAVVANVSSITKEIRWRPGEGPLHTKFDLLEYQLETAERERERAGVWPGRPDDAGDNTGVTVFFGTNRSKVGGRGYYGIGRDTLKFGRCLVNVPSDRRIGTIPRPSIWTLYRVNRRKHFVVLNVVEQDRDEFVNDLRAYVDGCGSKQALVFVHGFNVKFLDAMLRTAQIAADLSFPGVAIAFSWPSRGVMTLLGYTRDEEQVRWTLPDLSEFLELIAEQSGATTIHLVAHSMGNRVLTDALTRLGAAAARRTATSFNEVILTAPDIDAGTFSRDVAPAILPTARRVTLYASSNDLALKFSKTVHGYPRAGESGDHIVLIDGIDTIDVSSIDTGFVGHFYYGDNRSVLSDMFSLIKGEPAADRFGLKKRTKGGRSYWEFKPGRRAFR